MKKLFLILLLGFTYVSNASAGFFPNIFPNHEYGGGALSTYNAMQRNANELAMMHGQILMMQQQREMMALKKELLKQKMLARKSKNIHQRKH